MKDMLWEGFVLRKSDGEELKATIWDLGYAIVVSFDEDLHLLNEVILPDECKWILEKQMDKFTG
jgi:hypothetical protein